MSNLRKINEFYEQGGTIIFTTRLPSQAVEFGKDSNVAEIIQSIFPEGESKSGIVNTGSKGGKAIFIHQPDGRKLREALTETIRNFDVDYPVNENIRYIHKVINRLEVFYFANIGDKNEEIPITLRGKMNLQNLDPHTGVVGILKTKDKFDNETQIATTIGNLNLKPFQSIFWIGIKEK